MLTPGTVVAFLGSTTVRALKTLTVDVDKSSAKVQGVVKGRGGRLLEAVGIVGGEMHEVSGVDKVFGGFSLLESVGMNGEGLVHVVARGSGKAAKVILNIA